MALMISAALHFAYLIFSSTSESISPKTLSRSRKLAAATKFLAVFLHAKKKKRESDKYTVSVFFAMRTTSDPAFRDDEHRDQIMSVYFVHTLLTVTPGLPGPRHRLCQRS